MKTKLLIAMTSALALSACKSDYELPSSGNSLGSVALAGDAIVGSTLSADITEANGFESSNVTYTWMLDGVAIAGASSGSYVVTSSDEGSKISLSVSYVDNDGYSEIATSSLSDTVEIPAVQTEGSVAIVGDAYVDFEISAVITDENGSGSTPIEYVWMADGVVIDDADEAKYMLTADDLGKVFTVTVTYTDNDDFAESSTSYPTAAVTEKPADVITTKVASITDNMTDDAGELRYKHGSTIETGKISLSFAKEEVLTAEGSAKEAYIALYGNSTSTASAVVDLRIGNGTYTIRNSDIAVTSTFTPGEWIDVEMTWDASAASASVAPVVTITINGTAVTTEAFSSVSEDLESVMDGVKTVAFKLSDTSSVVTGAYLVDDFKLYSDLAGTSIAFEDNFENYTIDSSLDASPYDSSTAEAFVVEVIREGTAAPVEPIEMITTKVASITDTMTDDAGELRYKHGASIEAGKLSVSFAKDEVVTEDGSPKEAYIALYGSSTSTAAAVLDLRIGNGTYTIRNSDIAVTSTFTPGEWIDVEMTWDASAATDSVAPLVTLSINGSAVTTEAFTSVSEDLASVMDGVKTVVFKLGDTSSVVTGAYLVDDFKLYSDVTTIAFEDDFESYALDSSLDASPYDGSTAEAFVVEVTKEGTAAPEAPVSSTGQYASITDNMTDDAGELRYKHGASIEAGKLSVSFAKDEVVTEDGSAKEAYIALYGSSTSTAAAILDLRIGNGTYTIRNSDIAVTSTFTPGEWIDVEMTWDASAATDSVAPLVTLSINGTAVTTEAFSSVSEDLASVMDGVKTVAFKLGDTSSVVTGAYLVDDFKLYSDATTIAFEDDFEGYTLGSSLDASPYDSSTAEAVVAQAP